MSVMSVMSVTSVIMEIHPPKKWEKMGTYANIIYNRDNNYNYIYIYSSFASFNLIGYKVFRSLGYKVIRL